MSVSQSNGKENKDKQMGPTYTQKLLHSEENSKQNEKITHRLGENICKWCDWQRISLQNLQTAHEQCKNKQPTQKMGRRIK